MAKPAVPGRVKTRLMTEFDAEQAAAVHAAMSDCVLARLREHLPGDHVIALANDMEPQDPTEPGMNMRGQAPAAWRIIDQGTGDLGQRLDHVWQTLDRGPIIFFGVDSPDIPAEALKTIPQALLKADAVVGPVDDGGYWTLAAEAYAPALLRGIDWGESSVYHQTLQAARSAGLTLAELPRWHDVDEPADLRALQARLTRATEPSLQRLRDRLLAITGK